MRCTFLWTSSGSCALWQAAVGSPYQPDVALRALLAHALAAVPSCLGVSLTVHRGQVTALDTAAGLEPVRASLAVDAGPGR